MAETRKKTYKYNVLCIGLPQVCRNDIVMKQVNARTARRKQKVMPVATISFLRGILCL